LSGAQEAATEGYSWVQVQFIPGSHTR